MQKISVPTVSQNVSLNPYEVKKEMDRKQFHRSFDSQDNGLNIFCKYTLHNFDNKTANINTKKLQFVHSINGDYQKPIFATKSGQKYT